VTNRDLLTVALRNLHENAVQHTRPDGTVTWSASYGDSGATISLEDDGPGIPDVEMQLVTTRFFRGRHRSPYGSGLGLAIVKLALDKLGASMALKTKAAGSGLRVTLFLAQPPHYRRQEARRN
jgi:two-component system sensor histidine kinase QseC